MKELTHSEIEAVSGAGFVSDLINNALDGPARAIGAAIGESLGKKVNQVVDGVTGAINKVFEDISSFIGGIFGR
ncbi:hypothetical protein [Enterobacillus tribolii]|uniref:Uncharacterized protein n=1 Tax=Enterobacillus tribolii TaxID=1487935 RepID=A0A370R290_9GAMM|nr:hypothetical protein [Enterobacillus tribolii]MBW7984842.1 hypothetical protein [Enterobacillus tribolii]RDK96034.1 hypothetical protein C8D90_102521 [Enterobacillus tribolii]